MKLHLNSTSNLGDFLNALPVISGLVKKYNKVDFVIRGELKKFKGIKEFLLYQDLFNSVEFDSDWFTYGKSPIMLSSWTREDKNNPDRPIETCRYENWLKDRYGFKFDVDDDFVLKVENLNLEIGDFNYGADRWTGPNIDSRRISNGLQHLDNIKFLDYNNSLMENCYIIKNCKKPFISAFTGTAVLADLLNVEQIVLWTDDLKNWDGKPIQYSFEKHFYQNRKSKLMYIGEYENNLIQQ